MQVLDPGNGALEGQSLCALGGIALESAKRSSIGDCSLALAAGCIEVR